MALSSQMSRYDRPVGSWGSASKRRRGGPGRGLVLLLAAAGAVGAGGWGVWNFAGGEPVEASEVAVAEQRPAADPLAAGPIAPLPVATAPLPVELPPVVSAPVELEMGRGAVEQGAPAQPLPPAPEVVEPPARPATTTVDRLPSDIAAMVSAAERARAENKLVEARTLLNRALVDPRTGEGDRAALRQSIADLNSTLIFSPAAVKGDPLTDTYSVQGGDSLARITAKLGLGVDWRLVQRVNRISNPSRINVGQKLKVVRGPFHAVVDKSDFRIDLYAGEPIAGGAGGTPSRADGVEPGWIYIRSFRVGLGEFGTTPVGTFIVRPKSKLINPFWRNPRTGEEFGANDPKNPIGEHWLGLEGLDEATRQFEGYGIHGTIVPESIGKEMSMGCVRLAAEDVALVYEMLEEGVSIVRIVP